MKKLIVSLVAVYLLTISFGVVNEVEASTGELSNIGLHEFNNEMAYSSIMENTSFKNEVALISNSKSMIYNSIRYTFTAISTDPNMRWEIKDESLFMKPNIFEEKVSTHDGEKISYNMILKGKKVGTSEIFLYSGNGDVVQSHTVELFNKSIDIYYAEIQVQKAVETRDRWEIRSAKNTIDNLLDSPEKTDLLQRLDKAGSISGWTKNENNKWYYYNEKGNLVFGWIKDGETWFFLHDDYAEMQIGWKFIYDSWYYMNQSGAMQTGWTQVENAWYLLEESGVMQTGWNQIENIWYYLSTSGVMQTNWTQVGNSWYYMSKGGIMQTGWLKLGNSWYYLNNDGSMKTGTAKINNHWYNFNSSGIMQ